MQQNAKVWRCNVCGYMHRTDLPPNECPICGASASDFTRYEDPTTRPAQQSADHWQCIICAYPHKGKSAPESCPICEATQFERVGGSSEAIPSQSEAARIVIVGGGIAGVSAAESIRQASTAAVITIVSSESGLPYYRLNLTRYLAGEIDAAELQVHPSAWYTENRIELLNDARVESISPADQTLTLVDGKSLSYDRLILTAGAHPFVPPIPGCALAGVHTLRTVVDADRIIQQLKPGEPCVCIGGGILGLETAGALAARGADVTLLESHGWLMPRQLNEPAATVLEAHIATLGIKLRKSVQTVSLIKDGGQVAGVKLDTGDEILCGMVILCTGVRPNTALARKAGLSVNRGVLVDNHLRTSDPNIFAAGDIAEHNGVVYGIWGPAQYQGTIAGINALGGTTAFGGVPRSNTLKVLGMEMLSIGEFIPADGSCRVFQEQSSGGFRHFVFHDGRLIGAILLGHTKLAGSIKKAIEGKTDFSALLSGSPDCSAVMEVLNES